MSADAQDPAGRGQDAWWRNGLIYNVYVRSFQDSDGDGVGDLAGVLSRLDYLNDGSERSLGVDAIWLSPIHPSGGADFGYDVTDYLHVDPLYGGDHALAGLVEACHARGIRVVLDFVPNHTSTAHRWFVESRASRRSARRNWYIWADGAESGGPPNDWGSVFGGPGWTRDEASGQYYFHTFYPGQPELNWANPDVPEAIWSCLEHWLAIGVDGFRLDAVTRLLKPAPLPLDAPQRAIYGRPEAMELLRELRRRVDRYPGRMLIGEAYVQARSLGMLLGESALDGLHAVFNFHLCRPADVAPLLPWDAEVLAHGLQETLANLPGGGVSSFMLSTHDFSRFATRHNGDGHGAGRARSAALLLLALPGPPSLYYGEELGMMDADIPPGRWFDSAGRDGARAPMQWDGSPLRGFTTGRPWIDVADARANVAAQHGDPTSLLNLYRRASWLRKQTPSLKQGVLRDVRAIDGVLFFARSRESERPVLVAVNTANEQRELDVTGTDLLLTSSDGPKLAHGRLLLPPLTAAWVAE
jgi:alpha-glucosidase